MPVDGLERIHSAFIAMAQSHLTTARGVSHNPVSQEANRIRSGAVTICVDQPLIVHLYSSFIAEKLLFSLWERIYTSDVNIIHVCINASHSQRPIKGHKGRLIHYVLGRHLLSIGESNVMPTYYRMAME